MKLLVDIGNTVLKASVCEGSTIGKTYRYQGEGETDYILSLVAEHGVDYLAICSNRDMYAEDIARLKASCAHFFLVDPSHKHFCSRENIPEYLSADCACCVVAARHLFPGRACCIFDFGTVFTSVFTSVSGEVEGCNVSPGCTTRFRSIKRYARNFPLLDADGEAPVVGNSVNSSIRSGVIEGMKFEMEGYMSRYPQNVFIFTGGDSFYFAKRTKKSIFVISNMVLTGLSLIADDEEFV